MARLTNSLRCVDSWPLNRLTPRIASELSCSLARYEYSMIPSGGKEPDTRVILLARVPQHPPAVYLAVERAQVIKVAVLVGEHRARRVLLGQALATPFDEPVVYARQDLHQGDLREDPRVEGDCRNSSWSRICRDSAIMGGRPYAMLKCLSQT